jgi:hypothetical protein
LPHDPQLAPLVWRFTQLLPPPIPFGHTALGLEQPHTPSSHSSAPNVQELPQVPQFAVELDKSTHVCAPMAPLQSPFGLGQPQTELALPWVPVQTNAAPGQPSDGKPPVAAQQGSPSPPQSAHVPAKQPWPIPHGMLQPPQFCCDVCVLTHVENWPAPHTSFGASHSQSPATQT